MAKKKVRKTSAKKNKKATKSIKTPTSGRKLLARLKAAAEAVAASPPFNEAAYQRLRGCLALIRGWPITRITEDVLLEDDMGYGSAARAALAAELSDCFAEHGMPLHPLLKPAETRGCKTVGDLDDIIQTRV